MTQLIPIYKVTKYLRRLLVPVSFVGDLLLVLLRLGQLLHQLLDVGLHHGHAAVLDAFADFVEAAFKGLMIDTSRTELSAVPLFISTEFSTAHLSL